MKNGKLSFKSRNIKFLLGLAVAGALLFASCQNIFDPPAAPESGEGRVIISTELGTERTIMPYIDPAIIPNAAYIANTGGYTYKFYKGATTDPANQISPKALSELGIDYIVIPFGTYTVSVVGISNTNVELVEGTETFEVKPGITTVTVHVKPKASDVNGTFKFKITAPASADVSIVLNKWNGSNYDTVEKYGKSGTSADNHDVGYAANVYTAADTSNTGWSLTPGSYLFTVRIYSSGKYWGFTEAVHIYKSLTTSYPDTTNPANSKTVGASDLVELVNDADARKLLFDSIGSWIDQDVLVKPPISKNDNKEIYLYYLVSKVTSGAPAFPIQVMSQSNWGGAAPNWNMDITTKKPVTLTHSSTYLNNDGSTANTVTVYLFPVVRYNVLFNANTTHGETITFPDFTDLRPDLNNNAIFPASRSGEKYYGLVNNTTVIRVSNADITETGKKWDPNRPATADWDYPMPKLESKDYDINVHETVSTQFDTAVGDFDNPAPGTLMAQIKAIAANYGGTTVVKKQQTTPPTLTAADLREVTLPYIAGNIPTGTTLFPLQASFNTLPTTPNTPYYRWNLTSGGGDWTLATIRTIIQKNVVSVLYSTGDWSNDLASDPKSYTIVLKPVAKFNYTNNFQASENRTVTLVDAAMADTTPPTAAKTLANGPTFVEIIGPTTGTKQDTVLKANNSLITIKQIQKVPDVGGVPQNPTITEKYPNKRAPSGTNNVDNTYTFTGNTNATPTILTSNEYDIDVYKTNKEQVDEATLLVQAATHTEWVKGFGESSTGPNIANYNKLARPAMQKFKSAGVLAGTPPNDATFTKLYYTGTAAVDIQLPTGYDGYTLSPATTGGTASETRAVRFTPFGYSKGDTSTDPNVAPDWVKIYDITIQPVVQLKIRFSDKENAKFTGAKETDGSPTMDSVVTTSPQLRRINVKDAGAVSPDFYDTFDSNKPDKFDGTWWYMISDPGNHNFRVTGNGLITLATRATLKTDDVPGSIPVAGPAHVLIPDTTPGKTSENISPSALNITTSQVYEITVQPSQAQQVATAIKALTTGNFNPVGVFITNVDAAKNPPFSRDDSTKKFTAYYVTDTLPTAPAATAIFNGDLVPHGIATNWNWDSGSTPWKIKFKGDGYGAFDADTETYTLEPKKVAEFKVANFNVAPSSISPNNELIITNGTSEPVVIRNMAAQDSKHVDDLTANAVISADTAFAVTAPAGDGVTATFPATANDGLSDFNAATGKYELMVAAAALVSRTYTIDLYPTYQEQNRIGNAKIRTQSGNSWSWITEPFWTSGTPVGAIETTSGRRPDTRKGLKDSFTFTGARDGLTNVYAINGTVFTAYNITPPTYAAWEPTWTTDTWSFEDAGALMSPLDDVEKTLTLTYKGIKTTSSLTKPTYKVKLVPVTQIEVAYFGATASVAISDPRGLNSNTPDPVDNLNAPTYAGAPVVITPDSASKYVITQVGDVDGNPVKITFPDGGNIKGDFDVRLLRIPLSGGTPPIDETTNLSGSITNGLTFNNTIKALSARFQLQILLKTP